MQFLHLGFFILLFNYSTWVIGTSMYFRRNVPRWRLMYGTLIIYISVIFKSLCFFPTAILQHSLIVQSHPCFIWSQCRTQIILCFPILRPGVNMIWRTTSICLIYDRDINFSEHSSTCFPNIILCELTFAYIGFVFFCSWLLRSNVLQPRSLCEWRMSLQPRLGWNKLRASQSPVSRPVQWAWFLPVWHRSV